MAGVLAGFADAVKTFFTFDEHDREDFLLEDEIRIVLTGKTGDGKSETDNTILGKEMFESSFSGKSVTKKCKLQEAVRENKRIVVVDTPGFFDTKTPPEETKREVAKCIGITSPGPHCFLLVLAVGRFTPEDRKTVETVFELFGNDVQKYVIIIFTKLDNTQMKGKLKDKLKTYLEGVPDELNSFLDRCEHRCIAFNNTAPARKRAKQFKELLHLIEETVKKNGGRHYTSEMFEQAEKLIQFEIEEKKREALEKEQKVRDEISFTKEKEAKQQLEEERAKLNKAMEEKKLQLEKLAKEQEEQIRQEMAKAKEIEIEKKLQEEREKQIEERKKLDELQENLKKEKEREFEKKLQEERQKQVEERKKLEGERENLEKEKKKWNMKLEKLSGKK